MTLPDAKPRVLCCDCHNTVQDTERGHGYRLHRPFWDIEERRLVWVCESCCKVRDSDPRVTPQEKA